MRDTRTEPTSIPQVPPPPPRRGFRMRMSLTTIALWISLLLHGLTIGWLFGVRSTIRSELTNLSAAVSAAKDETIRYDLPIDQQIPIQVDVPIRQSLEIPIQTEVRIKQDVNVPIPVAGTTINLPVPLDVAIPISTTVPISFNQTVTISAEVPLKLTVPIQLDLGSSQMAGYLDRLRDAILALRERW